MNKPLENHAGKNKQGVPIQSHVSRGEVNGDEDHLPDMLQHSGRMGSEGGDSVGFWVCLVCSQQTVGVSQRQCLSH